MAYIIHPYLAGIYLWGIASAVLILCGALYYYRGNQKENYREKLFMHGFAYLFILFGISRVVFSMSESIDYYSLTSAEEKLFALNLFYLLNRIYYGLMLAGITFFTYTYEKVNRSTKFAFTIIQLVFLGVILFGDFDIMVILLSYVLLYFEALLGAYIILKIISWSQFEFKAISALLLQGYILMLLALGIYNSTLRFIDFTFAFIPPILMILGAIVIMAPILIDPNKISQAFKYWILLSFLGIGFAIYLEIYFLFNYHIFGYIYLINSTCFLVFLTLSIILVVKVIKTQPDLKKKGKPLDILEMFTRPPKFTEEEIRFYQKKQLCVVCKNKVSRLLYLCPECSVLYCIKCSEVLTKTENACWVCNTPFDETKPVELGKKVDEIEIEEEIHKKSEK